MTVATVHPADAAALAAVLRGHDVVVVSLKWDVNDIDAVIEAIRKSGVRRALIVVGAGSLRRADGRLHFDHMPTPSPSSKPAMVALDKLREVDDFDWTAISPPTSIKPGERTGNYRLGTDTMVVDAADNGEYRARILPSPFWMRSKNPKHVRQQIYGRLFDRRLLYRVVDGPKPGRSNMSNPVLVEVTRGPLVESRHRGAVAVVDAEAQTVLALGRCHGAGLSALGDQGIAGACRWSRRGAADRIGFGDEELALACASHSGEPAHVAGVERMLAAAGLDVIRAALRRALADVAVGGLRVGEDRHGRRRCITIAPASMRASCASLARWGSTTPTIGSPSIQCSAKCAP